MSKRNRKLDWADWVILILCFFLCMQLISRLILGIMPSDDASALANFGFLLFLILAVGWSTWGLFASYRWCFYKFWFWLRKEQRKAINDSRDNR